MNYFLKCQSCGGLNNLKTEYMVFCTHCNAKLKNNYSDWKRFNPEASFDDFKKEHCVTEESLKQNAVEKPEKKPVTTKSILGIVLGIVLFAVFSHLGKMAYKHFSSPAGISTEVLNQEMPLQEYGKLGMCIRSPFELNETDIPLTEEIKSLIEEMYSFTSKTKDGFEIVVTSARYNEIIGEPDLQGAANGSIAEMKSAPGVSNFDSSQKDIKRQGMDGFEIRGSFVLKGNKAKYINVGLIDGLTLYQLMIIHLYDDKNAGELAEKVYQSLEIKK